MKDSPTAGECVIGLDLGGTKVSVAAIDENLNVLHSVVSPAPKEREQIIPVLAELITQVRDSVELPVSAVGCGIPCLIDRHSGRAVMAVNLPINDLPFAELLNAELGLPVYVDNDANVAALAEYRFGAAQAAENVVMLTIGTGIGGGLILNGELYRGTQGAGAELGHITTVLDGPRCQGSCPNYGCLEAIASGTALIRDAQQALGKESDSQLAKCVKMGERLSGKLVTECARQGDQLSLRLLRELGERLGAGVVSLINIFNPDYVVIGGGVGAAGDLLLDPVREVVSQRALSPSKEFVQIVPAHFGSDAGVVGAAALAFIERSKELL